MTSWSSCDICGLGLSVRDCAAGRCRVQDAYHLVSVKGDAVLKTGLLFFVVGAIVWLDRQIKYVGGYGGQSAHMPRDGDVTHYTECVTCNGSSGQSEGQSEETSANLTGAGDAETGRPANGAAKGLDVSANCGLVHRLGRSFLRIRRRSLQR
jgi:hypothetical protein